MIVKGLFYAAHCAWIFLCAGGVAPYSTPLSLLTIASWQFNDNTCLLLQVEDHLFGDTLLDLYYRMRGIDEYPRHFKVPKLHRRAELLLTAFRCIYGPLG